MKLCTKKRKLKIAPKHDPYFSKTKINKWRKIKFSGMGFDTEGKSSAGTSVGEREIFCKNRGSERIDVDFDITRILSFQVTGK